MCLIGHLLSKRELHVQLDWTDAPFPQECVHAHTRTGQCVCLSIYNSSAPPRDGAAPGRRKGRNLAGKPWSCSLPGCWGCGGVRLGWGCATSTVVTCPRGMVHSHGAAEEIPTGRSAFPCLPPAFSLDRLLHSFLSRGPPIKMGVYSVACFSYECSYC